MYILGIVLMVLGAIIAVGGFTFLAIIVRKIARAVALEQFANKKTKITILGLIGGIGVGFLLFFLGIPFVMNANLLAYEYVCVVFGSLLLGIEIGGIYLTFRLHYYQKLIPEKIDKKLYYVLLSLIPILVLTVWLLTEGYANHVTYPLINGISWDGGLHFTRVGQGHPNIAWYALCIVSGAVYVYFICDHFMYKEFGKHGLLESTFLLAFPSGIIGARIAYVIGNWNVEFGPVFDTDPWKMFRMWEGGLTILGGAIAGIIVGVLWFHHVHKDISVGKAINIIVPTILIAQAVGRWGNFFNCEVHGLQVDGTYWQWLPTFIYKQMEISSISGHAAAGNIYVPLFLIEGFINLSGYFILAFGFGKWLKKYVLGGDLAFGYVAWYGATRMIMEPLRDPKFNMGDKARWSWIWAIVFICVGLLAIIVNHIIRYYFREKKNPTVLNNELVKKYKINSFIGLSLTSLISLAMFGLGLGLYLGYEIPEGASLISLCAHNIGFMLWTVGLSVLPSIIIPCLYLVKVNKFKNTTLETE